MRRILFLLALAAGALVLTSGSALASPSSSPDSGTCGNNWALDMFDRFFTIRQIGPTTYTVYEQYQEWHVRHG
jgi:hypothetical protein